MRPYDASSALNIDLPVYLHYERTVKLLKEYYPDMIFSIEDIQIDSLSFYYDRMNYAKLFDLTGLGDLSIFEADDSAEPEKFYVRTESAEVLMEIKDLDWYRIEITDPQEIAAYLPYLVIGNHQHNSFDTFRRYEQVGYINDSTGDSCNCYIDLELVDLPLKPTKTVQDHVKDMIAAHK